MFIYVTKYVNIIRISIKSTRNWHKLSNSLRYEGILKKCFINIMVRYIKVKIDCIAPLPPIFGLRPH